MQQAHHELVDERSRVDAWRLQQFLEAGYAHHRAELLASRPDVDVHVACSLLAHGCGQKLALKILL